MDRRQREAAQARLPRWKRSRTSASSPSPGTGCHRTSRRLYERRYRLDKQTARKTEVVWDGNSTTARRVWQFRDDEHFVRVDGDDVFAVGRNGFAFRLRRRVGIAYELRRKKPWTLGNERRAVDTAVDSRVVVMARRYLDEKDARAKMRLDEWAAEAKRHRARDAKKKSASPWNVPAMASKTMASERVKASPARKKTRTAE